MSLLSILSSEANLPFPGIHLVHLITKSLNCFQYIDNIPMCSIHNFPKSLKNDIQNSYIKLTICWLKNVVQKHSRSWLTLLFFEPIFLSLETSLELVLLRSLNYSIFFSCMSLIKMFGGMKCHMKQAPILLRLMMRPKSRNVSENLLIMIKCLVYLCIWAIPTVGWKEVLRHERASH